ncbi:LD-carboxypeptidase, partial [uncultured Dubosiella sp.]
MKKPKIGLLNLSDPLSRPLTALVEQLERQDVEVVLSPLLHDRQAPPEQKAKQFNSWMKEDTFDIVFDVSGGDLANTTIPSLDLEAYAQSHTVFAGYSDLTPVLNVLAPIRKTLLYQIRNNGRFDELIDFLFKRNEDL